MTAFDRAWDIAKENDDYSKFGDKFAARMKKLKEGGRGLPEGTKFSDLTPSTGSRKVRSFDRGDIHTEESRRKLGEMMRNQKPEMPEGVPINIFDLQNYRPDDVEIENNRIVDEIMGRKMKLPRSLIDRAQDAGPTPKDE